MWYAKQTDERIKFVNSLLKEDDSFVLSEELNQKKTETYDLRKMTITDEIENNFEKYHIYDTKEIIAIIFRHLRGRFPTKIA